jgi:hypothetical protein
MATAEIAPVVSVEMLKPGITLTNTEKEQEPFVIPLGAQAKPVEGASEITVEFTQSPPSVTVKVVEEVPSARMESVLFGALTHPELRLRRPIPLEISEEEGHVVLNWEATSEFSCGTSMGDALDDFSKTVSELYFELNNTNVRLGDDLEGVRRILDDYIERRR